MPRHLLLVGDDVDRQWRHTALRQRADILLAIRLLEEKAKGTASQWAPYIDQLPGAEELAAFHPLAATPADLERFAALPTVQRVREKKAYVKRQFDEMRVASVYEWESFWQAYVTYISRSYGIVIRSQHDGKDVWLPAIAPVSDMGNTASPKSRINTNWVYNKTAEEFQVVTTQEIPAGGEVYESYQISSLKDNAHLAFMFGFMLPDNPLPVEQLGSTACKQMLRSGKHRDNSSVKLAGKKKLAGLLRALVREHCRASGEEQEAHGGEREREGAEDEGLRRQKEGVTAGLHTRNAANGGKGLQARARAEGGSASPDDRDAGGENARGEVSIELARGSQRLPGLQTTFQVGGLISVMASPL